MSYNILPADTYVVVNKTIITEVDRRIITTLYQPIIGSRATSLYFTLVDDLNRDEIMSKQETHHHLLSTMQIKLENLVIAREKLEAVGLLKTYVKKEDNINSYVYILYSPMSVEEFVNHPILNVVLYNNVGKNEYNKILNYYKMPRISLKDYEDITSNFNSVFGSVNGSINTISDDIVNKTKEDIKLSNVIDMNMLISSIPSNLVSERCFNDEVKELINQLAFIYKIDDMNMQMIVRNSINEKGLIDKNELRLNCRKYYQFENGGSLPTLIYAKQPDYLKKPSGDTSNKAKIIYTFENVSPYDYLKSKYSHGEPSARELKIIEELMVDYKMPPGVVNVLISYVLKVTNQKFTKTYVDAVASQWSRLKIETVEEAMEVAQKEHNKLKGVINKNSTTKTTKTKDVGTLPSWFDEKLDSKEMSPEEQKEIDEMFKEFN